MKNNNYNIDVIRCECLDDIYGYLIEFTIDFGRYDVQIRLLGQILKLENKNYDVITLGFNKDDFNLIDDITDIDISTENISKMIDKKNYCQIWSIYFDCDRPCIMKYYNTEFYND